MQNNMPTLYISELYCCIVTVDAMEVLIKYCMNSFPQLINSFDRKLINFLLPLDEPFGFRFRTD